MGIVCIVAERGGIKIGLGKRGGNVRCGRGYDGWTMHGSPRWEG